MREGEEEKILSLHQTKIRTVMSFEVMLGILIWSIVARLKMQLRIPCL